jgi:hypothetical protein
MNRLAVRPVKRLVIFFLAVLVLGCGVREKNTLEKALIGHWTTVESGNTHYYFDQASLVMVDEGRRMDQNYTVLESNEKEDWIKIRVRTGYGVGHDKKLVFSANRDSLMENSVFLGVKTTTRWDYVDGKKKP